MIDVTIIVPVYNVEKYLCRCLDSLVNQDYDNTKYEVYVIDDFSSDSSWNIVLEYQKKYSNVIAERLNKNMGVSYVRNYGIGHANGKYLLFCDSDDYYRLDAVSKFMECAKKEKADFVMANYMIATERNCVNVNSTSYFSCSIITKEESICYMTLTSSSKLIKRDLFIKNNISYPEDLKQCEELAVIPVVSYYAKKPVVLDEYLYYYYQRRGSASNTCSKRTIDELSFFDEAYRRFLSRIDFHKYDEELSFRMIDHLIYGKTLVMFKSSVPIKEIKNHINNLKQQIPNVLGNKYFKQYNIAKKIFVFCVINKLLVSAKVLAKIHQLITR